MALPGDLAVGCPLCYRCRRLGGVIWGILVKRFVVDSLEASSALMAIGVLIVGVVVGYIGGQVAGAVAGLIVAFVIVVLMFGVVFTLLEMNESLRDIRRLLTAMGTGATFAAPGSPPGRPSPAASAYSDYPYSVQFKGVTIHHNNKEFVVGYTAFSTLEAAQAFINIQK